MKKAIRILLPLFLILLVFVSFSSAQITIEGPKYGKYNLGEEVGATAMLLEQANLKGFFKATIQCNGGGYNLNYFMMPINIDANAKKEVEISALPLTDSMAGECAIHTSLLTSNEESVDEASSIKFVVSNKLTVVLELNKVDILPGNTLKVSGQARTARDNEVKKASILFDEAFFGTKQSEFEDGSFEYVFELQKNITSKEHMLKADIMDAYGNKGNTAINFYVIPVPTELKNRLNKLVFNPEEAITIEALLFDQAGDLMLENAGVKLYDPDGEEMLAELVQTDKIFEYKFQKYAKPGIWVIKTQSSGLNIKSEVKVNEIEEIEFKIDSQLVVVTNIGNIQYEKPLEILFAGQTVVKNLDLDPGESKLIDLSDAAESSGTFDVDLKSGNKTESFEGIAVVADKGVISGVLDELSGMLFITGNIVGSGSGSWTAFYIIIAIMGIMLFFVYRNVFVDALGLKGRKKIDKKGIEQNISDGSGLRYKFKTKPVGYEKLDEYEQSDVFNKSKKSGLERYKTKSGDNKIRDSPDAQYLRAKVLKEVERVEQRRRGEQREEALKRYMDSFKERSNSDGTVKNDNDYVLVKDESKNEISYAKKDTYGQNEQTSWQASRQAKQGQSYNADTRREERIRERMGAVGGIVGENKTEQKELKKGLFNMFD